MLEVGTTSTIAHPSRRDDVKVRAHLQELAVLDSGPHAYLDVTASTDTHNWDDRGHERCRTLIEVCRSVDSRL